MARRFGYAPDVAIVETTKGKIRGYVDNGLQIFKGIPYAKAERFHAPEPMDPWEDVLDTTSYGYVCPLLEMPKPNGELLVPHRYWMMDENCQNLNVWTPGLDDKKRPVMVWLHGGGFFAGSAIEQIAYEGENMAKYGDVVVVSINHRLNVLGYFDLSDFGEEYANSGNVGMDDIIAALQWIQDNIGKFGGDPANVTLFGQSGGGAKVTTLLQMPAADGLFAKGINMSGVIGGVLADAVGSGKEFAEAIMKECKVETVKELEKVPFAVIADAYNKLSPEFQKAGKNVGGCPHPNAFYAGTPDLNGFRKESAQVPLMVGSVFGEFTSFAPGPAYKKDIREEDAKATLTEIFGEELVEKFTPLFKAAYPERHLLDLLNLDVIFRLPEIEYIRERSALNDCTFAYLFNYDLPLDGGRTPWHCSDIPYFFHNTELAPYTQVDGESAKLEREIFESVMAFAHKGNPSNAYVPEWPACTPEEEKTMVFDMNTRVLTNHDHELIPVFAKESAEPLRKYMMKNMEKMQH